MALLTRESLNAHIAHEMGNVFVFADKPVSKKFFEEYKHFSIYSNFTYEEYVDNFKTPAIEIIKKGELHD